MKYYHLIILFLVLGACIAQKEEDLQKLDVEVDNKSTSSQKDTLISAEAVVDTVEMLDTLEQRIINAGLVDVEIINANIWVDLKYSTTDNFLATNLYGVLTKAYLQEDIALRLAKVQDSLSAIDSTLHLLVYDAVRPRSVQWKMWRALDSLPVAQRIKFVSNPRNGSVHNYGCAVDLTICRADSVPLDMGANFDDLRKIAYPKYEKDFLKSGELSDVQLENRLLLRKVMRYGGFWVLSTEWWHFNGLSRDAAKAKYKAIE
ncbi:D-alanyl-D-alanine dipeptidase [Lishizhenia tianjinensis]|uniref:D-alanyl-D-alanine dipeptidase n=1 Tax=Lishizhenia tianjinensis TaxID=477690 RepID=A0A1I6YXP1_9FLAO|nr:M15 family metallopeptidase [Lishizhenia tianjinensis]SFT55154.1 D-alanyl-D-alanine dipeptidase [Lishizhenia tianjinensis]